MYTSQKLWVMYFVHCIWFLGRLCCCLVDLVVVVMVVWFWR